MSKKENEIVGTYFVLMGVLNAFAEFLKKPMDRESLKLVRSSTLLGLKTIDASFDAFLDLMPEGDLGENLKIVLKERGLSFGDMKKAFSFFREHVRENIKELEKISEEYYKELGR